MKTIDTLVEDIKSLFLNGFPVDQVLENKFGKDISSTVCSRIRDYGKDREGFLRLSSLGKPDRQLWYSVNKQHLAEPLGPDVLFKFMYGDMLEDVVLFLAELAGHTVEYKQHEVTCGGIVGHIDAVIDGVLCDVKSASTYGTRKFKDGSIIMDDPFGYIPQLSAYHGSPELSGVVCPKRAGFLVIGKERGDITFCPILKEDMIDAEAKAKHQKKVVAGELPDRCEKAAPDGQSGNMKLTTKCSYCPFKYECWKDSNGGDGLRTFFYSNGPRFLTEVVKVPNVAEKM